MTHGMPPQALPIEPSVKDREKTRKQAAQQATLKKRTQSGQRSVLAKTPRAQDLAAVTQSSIRGSQEIVNLKTWQTESVPLRLRRAKHVCEGKDDPKELVSEIHFPIEAGRGKKILF